MTPQVMFARVSIRGASGVLADEDRVRKEGIMRPIHSGRRPGPVWFIWALTNGFVLCSAIAVGFAEEHSSVAKSGGLINGMSVTRDEDAKEYPFKAMLSRSIRANCNRVSCRSKRRKRKGCLR